jgi:hypothetical protein
MKKYFTILLLFSCALTMQGQGVMPCGRGLMPSNAETMNAQLATKLKSGATGEKSIYLPYWIYDGAAGNYFSESADQYADSTSRFNTKHMMETENFVFLWEKGYGNDPSKAPAGYKVNVTNLLKNLERMYAFYRDSLKFVDKGSSQTDKYKMVVYLFYDKDFGTVFGSGSDNKVGVMLLYPSRVQSGPYGALAHELGHAFQYMVQADGHAGLQGTAWEMTSQYMLWQYYPTWPTFESYHVSAFLNQTYLAFMHPDNQYHSPFVLEYWADLHGPSFIGKLWKSAKSGEDFVSAYRRINGLKQSDFCDEMFDGTRRFITWDLKRGNTIKQFANQHKCKLNATEGGWFQIDASNAPQNYGYNGIRLNLPSSDKNVEAAFVGLTEGSEYHFTNKVYAGWRYGFVVQMKDGTRAYSPIYSSSNDTVEYTIPDNASYLWFVVMGAPREHIALEDQPGQWPYKVRFGNTNVFGVKNNTTLGVSSLSKENIAVSMQGNMLYVSGLSPKASVRICTLGGALISASTSVGSTYSTQLSEGCYLVSVHSASGDVAKKILVQ